MGLLKALTKFSGRQVGGVLDAAILRIKDKYTISLKVVDGGFRLHIDDRKPEATIPDYCEVEDAS